jgi:N-methylhydantoinase A/oxoprolinase/acetone carboxylase beta subunit
MSYRIGIDVGGTHTDAVILNEKDALVHAEKVDTTEDVSSGINNALKNVLERSSIDRSKIVAVMFGTTHCTNAVVERKNLAHVGVLRIGKPATMGVPPLFSIPKDLKQAIGDTWSIVSGGHEFDGREIWAFDENATRDAAKDFKAKGVESVAISSVFSPVNAIHEERAGKIFSEVMGPGVPITLSHEIGSIGLLERENAAALNAALMKVAERAISGFVESIKQVGLASPKIYLTQNDGTLMSVQYARKYPVRTIASGPTNSMRGAAFLTGMLNGIVIDIGGTTALVGAITHGFPRESSIAVEIGGARTNFRMPDLLATSCGGGTVVKYSPHDGTAGRVKIGPESIGFRISTDSVAWGGKTLTTTDVSLGLGYAKVDDPNSKAARVSELYTQEQLEAMRDKIISIIEESIDRMKTSADAIEVVLVGGGGIIVPEYHYSKFKGVSKIIRPENFQYANAIGAAIAQASGEVDRIYELDKMTREQALEKAKQEAIQDSIAAGAEPSTVTIVEAEELPLSYLPGLALRIRAKAVGKLLF